ncbi:MAG TPA: ATP-dependent Clp protease ATP-binding subunit [bacterium]|nr:ATP-dependent Clp protease ATP-binding subunit [bacterium]
MADFHYQGFTPRAKKLVHIAQNLGITLGVRRMGDEFLLFAILKMGEGLAFDALRQLEVEPGQLTRELEQFIREKYQTEANLLETPDFGPTAARRLQSCAQLAVGLGQDYVGTEHILLVLLKGGGTHTAQLLAKYGIDFEKARAVIFRFLGAAGKSAPDERAEAEAEDEEEEDKPRAHGPAGLPPGARKSLVAQFSRDLTKLAEDGKLDPVIGREKEIARLEQILSRRTKNNPVLIGDPGVGKTAIVEGLAQRIVAEQVPQGLRGKRLLTLDLAGIVAGTKYRGQFEQRLKSILAELIAKRDAIVFLDELHTIIGAGSAEGSMDAANLLKPALARGELQCIGATTLDEYKKYIEKDAALERRFQPVNVPEPTVEETVAILRGLRPRYEEHHRVAVADDALVAAARLSKRYLSDRFLPDKAVDLMDESCARLQLATRTGPDEREQLAARLTEIEGEKRKAINEQDYERAAELRDEEKVVQQRLVELGDTPPAGDRPTVTATDIARLIAQWTGIPVDSITEAEGSKLLRIEDELRKRVIGQEEAISAVAKAIRRARTGLKDPAKPAGTFLFLGPTGVGKTELARALALFLFGEEEALIRIDMSEFVEKFAVSRLTGAPPGYVGYEEGGQLTEAVRRRPFAVVLLDEIEKAHPDVFNILLQVLDDGQLSDNLGHTVDFKNAVVIMTSNVGGRDIAKGGGGVGFIGDSDAASFARLKESALSELKKTFNPEFLNRLDEIIVFHPLDHRHLRAILDIMLHDLEERLTAQELRLELTDAAKELLVTKGDDRKYGARPLLRVLRREIEEPLSLKLLEGSFVAGDVIIGDAGDNALIFSTKPSA